MILRRSATARCAVALLAASLLSACGTRLPQSAIETAAGQRDAQPAETAGVAVDAGTLDPAATGAVSTGASGDGTAQLPTAGAAPATRAPGGAGPGPATGSPIKIGNIGTYSGVLGAIFSGGQPTAQSFARWLNARGGLNGHPIEIVTADDGADPARYLALVKQMVEQQGVIAFMGNLGPFSANGAQDYLEQRRIPVIGGEVINAVWTSSPMHFPQATAIEFIERALPKLGVDQGHKKFGILYCGESTLCTQGAAVLDGGGAVRDAGGEVVYSAQVSLAQPDFTAECLQAKSKGVDVIVVGADGNTLSRAANSCAQQGYRPQWITLSLAIVDSIASNRNLTGASASIGTFPWVATDIDAANEFRAAMKQYSPNTGLSAAASAVWTSGLLLQAAGVNLPKDNPTSQHLLEGLWSLKNDNLGGAAPPLTFTRDQPAPPATCFFVMALKDGAWSAPQGSMLSC